MAGPWEKYQQAGAPAAPAGPWTKYAAQTSAPPEKGPETTNPGQMANYAAQSAATGFGNLLSAPNQILQAIMSVGPLAYNAVGHPGMDRPAAMPNLGAVPDAGKAYTQVVDALRQTAGTKPLPPANNILDKLASSTGEALGASAIPAIGEASVAAQPIRTLASELFTTAASGLGSGVAGAATNDNPTAELIGAIFGGGAGALGKGAVKKAITPFPTSPERLAAADTMAQNGVDLTAGQKTGSKSLKYAESELGGVDAAQHAEQQGGQFTRAVLAKAGINADRATPDVLAANGDRLSNEFNSMAAKTSVPLDQQLQNEMLQVASDYQSVAGAPAPAVEQMVNRAGELAAQNGGVLAGDAYQNLRSKIGELSRNADGPTKGALLDLQDALDDAVQRNLPPDILPQWQQTRREYKNTLVIEKAASAGGENAALGILSPAQLRMADVGQNRRAYVRGKSDFSELAHAGNATMTPLPQSGTAPRQAARGVGMAVRAGAGFAAGTPLGPPGQIAGAIAAAGAPWAVGKGIMTNTGQKYLGNQVLKPRAEDDPRYAAVLSAIMANGAGR